MIFLENQEAKKEMMIPVMINKYICLEVFIPSIAMTNRPATIPRKVVMYGLIIGASLFSNEK